MVGPGRHVASLRHWYVVSFSALEESLMIVGMKFSRLQHELF